MSTPLHRDAEPEPGQRSLEHLESPLARRPTCEEELAGRARERTNAHATTPPTAPARERVGYASRELERLARGLEEQSVGLRAQGDDAAAAKLDRTARELISLSHAIAARRQT